MNIIKRIWTRNNGKVQQRYDNLVQMMEDEIKRDLNEPEDTRERLKPEWANKRIRRAMIMLDDGPYILGSPPFTIFGRKIQAIPGYELKKFERKYSTV